MQAALKVAYAPTPIIAKNIFKYFVILSESVLMTNERYLIVHFFFANCYTVLFG